MAQRNSSKRQVVYEPDEESDDIDEMQDNSFEGGNKIYELKSQIHSLQIEKNKLSLEHQAALASMEAKNQQLNQQINTLKRENTKLVSNIRKLEIDNEEQKKLIDTYKHQVDSVNRRTADFHRSVEENHPLGDPTELINQLLVKDKKIEELNKKIEALEMRPTSSVSSSVATKLAENDREKYEQEARTLKNTIDDLKKKQIAYKREYEGMIQAKEEIIKKMSNQNDEFSRKIAESKDKIITEMRKEHEDMEKKLQNAKNQLGALTEKLASNEREMAKIRAEYKRKEESLVNHYEAEKDDLTRGLNQKMKKQIKDKEDKLNKNEERALELQNQLLIMKQELGKQKAEVVSLNQYNSYLQTSNKEYEEAKKKLQGSLYDKQRQIGELRQASFTQIKELKKNLIQERAQIEQKMSTLEQELLSKNLVIEKYENQIVEMEKREQEGVQQVQNSSQREVEKLKREKEELTRSLELLEERYNEKSERMNNLEKKIRGQFMERITGLEAELLKQRQRSKQQKKQPAPVQTLQRKPSNSEQLQKYLNISELRKLQIQQKSQQLRKLVEDKNKSERELTRLKEDNAALERKIREKGEDYKNLEISYDELSDKYRKGVKELQVKMEEMQEQIVDQRRKAQRRKNQAAENEKQLSAELKQYKSKVKELEEQVGEYRNRKVEQAQHTDLKLQKLAHQISLINKQKDSAIKKQQLRTKQKQQVLQQEKNKLLEYIEQLEDNNDILNKKVAMLEGKEKKNGSLMEKELRELKIQYSESLKEVNLMLQKYKKLEEVHRETIANIDNLKEEKEILNKKYVEIYKEKNKIFDELNSAYDQINKLNLVLMSKQEQLHRSKPVNCPHYETKSRVYTTQLMPDTPAFSSSLGPSHSKSPQRFYDRTESYYTANNPSNARFTRYG